MAAGAKVSIINLTSDMLVFLIAVIAVVTALA